MKYEEIIQLGKEHYKQKLVDLNWYKFADKNEIEQAINETEDNILLALSLAEFVFDGDGFSEHTHYNAWFHELFRIFSIAVESIETEQDENLITIHIKTTNNAYEYIVDTDQTEDWFDEDLIDFFINKQFLQKENILERFFILPPVDENIAIYYTHPTTQHKAKTEGLIPPHYNYFFDLEDNQPNDEDED